MQVKRTIVRTSLPDQRRTLVTDLEVFTTNGETLVIAKNNCKIKLNSQLGDSIIIKVLNGALIIPDFGRIDEDWDEIVLEKVLVLILGSLKEIGTFFLQMD